MKQAITAYHKDAQSDWVAVLACGHYQHVRHKPPWVETKTGRNSKFGYELDCVKCDRDEPLDLIIR